MFVRRVKFQKVLSPFKDIFVNSVNRRVIRCAAKCIQKPVNRGCQNINLLVAFTPTAFARIGSLGVPIGTTWR
jgi:hypothetical protein